jgi:hypothetical protein
MIPQVADNSASPPSYTSAPTEADPRLHHAITLAQLLSSAMPRPHHAITLAQLLSSAMPTGDIICLYQPHSWRLDRLVTFVEERLGASGFLVVNRRPDKHPLDFTHDKEGTIHWIDSDYEYTSSQISWANGQCLDGWGCHVYYMPVPEKIEDTPFEDLYAGTVISFVGDHYLSSERFLFAPGNPEGLVEKRLAFNNANTLEFLAKIPQPKRYLPKMCFYHIAPVCDPCTVQETAGLEAVDRAVGQLRP